ncbi:MAG: hypothetical protein WA324_09595 [Bryobacteraceae bacterium]
MKRVCWQLAKLALHLVEPAERIAVEGDLKEAGANGLAALRDVLGLVVRRQAALWQNWRPWLALIGVAGLTAVFLSESLVHLGVDAGLRLDTYLRYGVRYETGVTARNDLVFLAITTLALLAWSWTGALALAALSGRAVWITLPLFYLVAMDSYRAHLMVAGAVTVKPGVPVALLALGWLLPLSPLALLFVLAAVAGARRGSRHALAPRSSAVLASSVAALTVLVFWTGGWYEAAAETWSGGVWHPNPWSTRLLPLLMMSWPTAYILATSWQRRNQISDR